MVYDVTVLDEKTGRVSVLTMPSDTYEGLIYAVESLPGHEYEIIEIEKV